MGYYKPGLYSNVIAAQKYNDEQLRKQYEKKEAINLKELGKFSAFKEAFEEIKLEDQDFSYLNATEDITLNQSFIEGRNFGFSLIKNGFNVENYHEYIKSTETKKKHR